MLGITNTPRGEKGNKKTAKQNKKGPLKGIFYFWGRDGAAAAAGDAQRARHKREERERERERESEREAAWQQTTPIGVVTRIEERE